MLPCHNLIFIFIVNFSESPKAKPFVVSSHRLRLRSAFWQFWPLRCQWYLSSTTVRKFPMPIKTLLELCFIYHLSINRDSVRWPTSLVMCMQGMAAMFSPERLLLLHTLSPLTERVPWSEGSIFTQRLWCHDISRQKLLSFQCYSADLSPKGTPFALSQVTILIRLRKTNCDS